MDHFFKVPVLNKGSEQTFTGRLVTFGYTYIFYVMVDGEELEFERDEERNYRVLSAGGYTGKKVDADLLGLIVVAL